MTPEPANPQFMPLSPMSGSAFLTNLYNLITRPLKKRERTPGYIYGFKRDGEVHIKVGFTTKDSVEPRMDEWNRQCKQQVTVVLAEYVPHAGKMESLVHATLYHKRRREALVNGACNGGRGCGSKHREWIEVTRELLKEVVDVWMRWFESVPYDKDGCLKPEWVEKIYKLRKEQKKPLPDLWRVWIDTTTLAENITVEEKSEVVDDKGTVAFNVKEKPGIIVTETEIKAEMDDKVAADDQALRQGLSDLNRRYVRSIVKVKDETAKDKPLMDYPEALPDLPLQDDPFGPSVVTTVPA